MSSVREQLLASRVSKPEAGCTPVPCPDCPVPGVFVARMSGKRFIEYAVAISRHEKKDGDTPDQADAKRMSRMDVQLRFAAVDADGKPLFDPADDLTGLAFDVTSPIVEVFNDLNGLTEKKSPPPNSPPAG